MPLPRPAPPTGFLSPSAVSAVTSASDERDELPRPAVAPPSLPELSRPCFMPQSIPGIHPSELSPPEEPCRLPAAFCFPSGSSSTVTSGAKIPRLSDRFPSRAATLPRPEPPVKRTPAHDVGHGDATSPDREADHPPLELPRAAAFRPTGDLRARRLAAVSPDSKLCSPRESVHATDRARLELAPAARHGRPGRCSPGFSPLQSFPTTTSGSVGRDDRPAVPNDRGSLAPLRSRRRGLRS
jgi:hypothetical protein